MKSLLETTENTRDLGGYLRGNGEKTRCYQLLRSDKPAHPSENDFRFLLSHGITTIIDLREESAVNPLENPFGGHPGFSWHHYPILEGSGIPESVEAVPLSYLKIAESRGAAQAFRLMASAPGGVLFHCSAGKDRTGTLSAILLTLADVPEEAIIQDYLRTRDCLQDRLALLHQRFPELDMNIVTPSEHHIAEFLRLWKEKYTDAEGYFRAIGLSDEQIEALRRKLERRETHAPSQFGDRPPAAASGDTGGLP